MRRGCIALAIAFPLLASLMGSVGAAHARPLPSSAVMQSLLLTKAEMIGASGYKGQLTEAGGASCNDTPDGGRDCAYGVQPADYNLPDTYPSMVVISGFPPTFAGATKHWREHHLQPTAWSGETIAIVTKTARLITFTATPSSPDQMAWAWTSIKGKQGIMMAQCTANRTGADLKALAECSSTVAAALDRKVKAKRPRTPLA